MEDVIENTPVPFPIKLDPNYTQSTVKFEEFKKKQLEYAATVNKGRKGTKL